MAFGQCLVRRNSYCAYVDWYQDIILGDQNSESFNLGPRTDFYAQLNSAQ